jgi:hypothetical protein
VPGRLGGANAVTVPREVVFARKKYRELDVSDPGKPAYPIADPLPDLAMRRALLPVLLVAALAAPVANAARYTYHGELLDGDVAADGAFDLQVRTYLDPQAKRALGEATELPNITVKQGSFAIELDLPDNASGDTFVAVAVRKAGSGDAYETLGAPQPVSKVNTGCWALDGNTGLPAGSFLGIADPANNAALELRAANVRIARFLPGGAGGTNAGAPAVALGSSTNTATAVGSTVSGGGATNDGAGALCPTCRNSAEANFATVGGGRGNRAAGLWTVIAGGTANTATATGSSVLGGIANQALGQSATIGGGDSNRSTASYSTVGGGADNEALGAHSTIGGGDSVRTTGVAATVPGGRFSCAGGDYSFAAGHDANTRYGNEAFDIACNSGSTSGDANGDEGTFVWADSTPAAGSLTSTGPNQFIVRASGGVMINTNALPGASDDLVLKTRATGNDPDVDIKLLTRSNKSAAVYVRDNTGALYIGLPDLTSGAPFLETSAGAFLSNGGVWTNASSRELKEAFARVDTGDILARVLALPISTWQYKTSTEGRHLGPVAEDFKQAFGLAGDGRSIPTVDADGVALAAIQGLNAKLEDENAALRVQLDEVLARLARLEEAGVGNRRAAGIGNRESGENRHRRSEQALLPIPDSRFPTNREPGENRHRRSEQALLPIPDSRFPKSREPGENRHRGSEQALLPIPDSRFPTNREPGENRHRRSEQALLPIPDSRFPAHATTQQEH